MRFYFYLLLVFIFLTPSTSQAWRKIYRSQDTLSTETSGPIIELPGGGFLQAINTNCYGNSNSNILIVRLDPQGIRSWTKLFGGTGDEVANDMKITPLGEVIVAGSTSSYGNGKHDFYIFKIDQNGTLIWSKTFGSNNEDILSSIELNTNGDITLLGTTTSQSGNQNFLAIRIDHGGNQLWNHVYQNNITEVCNGSTILHNGNLLLVGYELNGVSKNSLALTIDGNGNMVWKKTYSNPAENYLLDAVELSDSANILLVGGILNVNHWNYTDGYSVKIDLAGNANWIKPFFPYGYITKIEATEDNSINLFGYYGNFNYSISMTRCDTAMNYIGSSIFNMVEVSARNESISLSSVIKTNNNNYLFTGNTNFEGLSFPFLIETDSLGIPNDNFISIYHTNNLDFCEGDSTIISAPAGFDKYFWFDVSNYFNIRHNSDSDSIITIKDRSTIRLIATKGAEIFISQTIQVNPKKYPTVTVSTTSLQYCKFDQSPYVFVTETDCDSIQWYRNNVVIPGEHSQYFTPDTSGQYFVVGTNQCGIDTSTIVNVNANYFLHPILDYPILSGYSYVGGECIPHHFQVASIPNTSYQWFLNSSVIVGQTSNVLTMYPVSTTGQYYCIASNGCGTDTSDYGSIWLTTVNTNTFTYNSTSSVTGCSAHDYTVSTNAPVILGNVQWFNQNNQLVFSGNSFRPQVTGNYCYQGLSDCDLMTLFRSPLFYFEVNPSPIPVVTPNGNTLLCNGDSTTLTASCQHSGATFQWQKNGIDILGATDSIYTAVDSSAYTCIAVTSCGVYSSNIVHINNYSLQGTLTSASTTICSNDSIKLNIQSAPNVTAYKWRKNGQLINSPSINYLYINQPGNYDCLLFGHCNDSVLTNQIIIQSAPLPTATILNNTTLEKCIGDSVKLEVSSQIGNMYEWHKVGSGNIYSTDSNLFTFQNGTYFVKISNSNCHIYSDTTTVAFTKNFNNILSDFDGGICNGSSIELKANSGYNSSYQWIKDNVLLQNANDSILTTAVAGNYQVIINSSFCYDTSNVFVVRDSILTQNSIVSSFAQTVCSGSSVVLSSLFPSGQFQWAYNDSLIPGATTNSITANNAGTYTIIATNTAGCTGKASIELEALDSTAETLTHQIGNSPFCDGDSLMIFVSPEANTTYQWYFNNSIIPNATNYYFYATSQGFYKCWVNNNCSTHFNDSLQLATKSLPINSTNNFSHLPQICINTPIVLIADPVTDADYYSWNLPYNIHPISALDQQHIIVQADYQFVAETISVSGVNECGNSTPVSALVVREYNCLPIYDPTQNTRNSGSKTVDIFPNPTQNNFTIRLNGEEPQSIQIINSIGEILRVYIQPKSDIIFGDELPQGIYFIKFTGSDRNEVETVVKM